MNYQDLKKLNLPDQPGVYFFLDKKKKVLYVGRATSLRDRVKSYFSKDLIGERGPIIIEMVDQAKTIKFQTTDSVLEAIILEANLIKKYKPKYNTKEKDDKSFNYVVITKEEYPKILIKRGKNINLKTETNVYGPFPSGNLLKEALKIMRRLFPFLDEKSSQKNNYEFYNQLGLVPGGYSRSQYLKNIRNLKLFFEGKKDKIIKNFEKEMKDLARAQKFEEASEMKRKIFALKHIQDVALIKDDLKISSNFRIEAYDIAHQSGKDMVGVMVVVTNNEADKNEYRKFKIRSVMASNDTAALEEVLRRRLGHFEWPLPNLIVIDGGTAQRNRAEKVLKELNFNIPIVAVVKDERHRPKEILGQKSTVFKYESEILLANHEAHRFAISYHRNLARKIN